MANAPNKLIAIGFAAIGAGYIYELFRNGSRPVTPLGMGSDGVLPARLGAPTYANGQVLNVKDGVKTIKFHPAGSIDNRLKFIIDQMKKDARDPKTITEATTILSGKCPTAKGGLKWCLPVGTLILRKPYDLVPIEDIRPGDTIMGDGGWTEVLNAFDTGVQPVLAFELNNGSVLRCTADHKLFVIPRVDGGGKTIPRGRKTKRSYPGKREDAIEVLAKDIHEGDELLQPEALPFGREEMDPSRALIMGAYIAEGWLEPSRASIAGIPENKGVREQVIAAAEKLGIPYSTDQFKVRLKSREVADWLSLCGKLARNKRLPTLNLGEKTVRAMLVGINADASMRPMRKTQVPNFCTTSSLLAQQYRVLYRMLGHSASVKVWPAKGAKYHPVYAVNVRTRGRCSGTKAWAKVKKIEKQAMVQTYDLETASRRIYLPECDVVVHNCTPVRSPRDELAMLFHAVTNPNSPYALRYTRDPRDYDAFRSADLMRRVPAADCFVHGTLVLRDDHKLVPVETLRVGDRIWGYDKWTAVTQTWEKGILPTWWIRLNNGSSMRLTPEHKVWVLEADGGQSGAGGGRRVIRVRDLTSDTRLIRPAQVDGVDRGRASGELRIVEIIKDDLALPCFDFATEDQCIWLPEADWTVHNCDDMSIRLGAWLLAVGYSVRCRIVAPAGQPGQWAHIYLMVGTPAGEDKKWVALDPTEADRGPFWEVPRHMIASKRDFSV